MTDFADTQWAQSETAAEFVENADRYIVERRRMLAIVRSLYLHFVDRHQPGRHARILDLGSGDGVWSQELLKADNAIEATLVDASDEMLDAARTRLKQYARVKFVRSSFQELLAGGAELPTYDMIVSGLAIHHLDRDEKKALFSQIRDHLDDGGQFVNVDVVLARDADLEGWYMQLWREWIREQATRDGTGPSFEHIPQQYKDNTDNSPDPLDEQLAALTSVGFKSVDCYYKYGIFAVYGGQK